MYYIVKYEYFIVKFEFGLKSWIFSLVFNFLIKFEACDKNSLFLINAVHFGQNVESAFVGPPKTMIVQNLKIGSLEFP